MRRFATLLLFMRILLPVGFRSVRPPTDTMTAEGKKPTDAGEELSKKWLYGHFLRDSRQSAPTGSELVHRDHAAAGGVGLGLG